MTDGLISPLLAAVSLSASSLSDSELELLALATSCEGIDNRRRGLSVSLLSIGLERPATVELKFVRRCAAELVFSVGGSSWSSDELFVR